MILRCFRKVSIQSRQLMFKSTQSADKKTPTILEDWNQNEEFFSFTRGRFVFNGQKQLQQRYIRFNMNALAHIAVRVTGATKCINIDKYPDGLYNKTYLFTMDNGKQVVGKVPNPNAGIIHYTTASEVATMDFMRNILQTPAPQVYAWNSRVDSYNPVGAEYIIMEKMPGVPLAHAWHRLDLQERVKLIFQVVEYQRRWAATKFPRFGNLYYADDTTSTSSPPKHLYTDAAGDCIVNSRFAVGPIAGREWTDEGRRDLQCDRGPWASALDYRTAIGLREKMAVDTLRSIPKQMVIFYGPDPTYQPSLDKKKTAIDYYLSSVKDLLPGNDTFSTGHLWHSDLHAENIMVDMEEPTKITGIIDWQSTQILPLYDHILDVQFLGYEGPDVGEDLQEPKFPSAIKSIADAREKEAATAEFFLKTLMIAWRMYIRGKNPEQYRAIRFNNTTAGGILNVSRNVYCLGEAHMRSLFVSLKEEWEKEKSDSPFPIKLCESEIEQIKKDSDAVMLGMRVMEQVAERLGDDLWPDNNKGLIDNEKYDSTISALKGIKEELREHFVHSKEDLEAFEKFWVFDC